MQSNKLTSEISKPEMDRIHRVKEKAKLIRERLIKELRSLVEERRTLLSVTEAERIIYNEAIQRREDLSSELEMLNQKFEILLDERYEIMQAKQDLQVQKKLLEQDIVEEKELFSRSAEVEKLELQKKLQEMRDEISGLKTVGRELQKKIEETGSLYAIKQREVQKLQDFLKNSQVEKGLLLQQKMDLIMEKEELDQKKQELVDSLKILRDQKEKYMQEINAQEERVQKIEDTKKKLEKDVLSSIDI